MIQFNLTYVYWDAEGNQCYSTDFKTPQAMRDWYMRNKSTLDENDRKRMDKKKKELRKDDKADKPTAEKTETEKGKTAEKEKKKKEK